MNWRNFKTIEIQNNSVNVEELLRAFKKLDESLENRKNKDNYSKFSKFEMIKVIICLCALFSGLSGKFF